MKILDSRRLIWLRRHQALSFANRLHHKATAKRIRRGEVRIRASFYVGDGHTKRGWVANKGVALPKIFCLDDNYSEVATFMERFRASAHDNLKKWISRGRPKHHMRRVNAWFDLATIERITPSAALIFTAEYDRIRRLTGRKMFAINVEKWHPEVASVFQQLGLFELLEIDSVVKSEIENNLDENLFVLPIRSGDRVLGAEASQLNNELADVAIEVARSSVVLEVGNCQPSSSVENDNEAWLERAAGIYGILVEAMDNVIAHAYPSDVDYKYPIFRRWWMTAAIDRSDCKLTVAIFDQGVSIPVSLPHWRGYGRVKRVLRRVLGMEHDPADRSHDGEAIRLAARVAVSSTDLEHRGKGLAVMQEFIDECRDGRLRIISRSGEYRYFKGQKPLINVHDVMIGGTLLEWEIRL